MSYKFDSVIDTSFEGSDYSLVAKLRRLKIQEGLLIKNINKISPKEHESEVGLPVFYSLEFKQFVKNVKDSFTAINIKFEDIKAQAEEKLSCLDIETMKRDVIKLDEKIRTFKNFLQSELATTVSKEAELTKGINNGEEKQTNSFFKAKSKTKLFNHIVPSPVKVLIKSPFKCKEVQDLQEFMMNSANRYGGWKEYNHNIFAQIWQKHEVDIATGDTEAFVNEILHKIAGSTKEAIITHQNWYSKYLYLKEQQQNALNKWKRNQQLLTKTNKIKHKGEQKHSAKTTPFNSNNSQILDLTKTVETNDEEEIISALCNMSLENEDFAQTEIDMTNEAECNISEDTIEAKRVGGILKPTKQWTNRCNSLRDTVKNYNNIDDIRKLRVPDWRLTLKY